MADRGAGAAAVRPGAEPARAAGATRQRAGGAGQVSRLHPCRAGRRATSPTTAPAPASMPPPTCASGRPTTRSRCIRPKAICMCCWVWRRRRRSTWSARRIGSRRRRRSCSRHCRPAAAAAGSAGTAGGLSVAGGEAARRDAGPVSRVEHRLQHARAIPAPSIPMASASASRCRCSIATAAISRSSRRPGSS